MAMCIARSKGWDIYNETLTRSVADNEPLKAAIKLFHKWTYVDHIAPTAADVASMNTDAGYGGADFSEFHLRQVRDDRHGPLLPDPLP